MERINDAMTICTLARPDVITISVKEYADLIKTKEKHEKYIDVVMSAISLDHYRKPQIDYKGDDLILIGSQILEPEAFFERIEQLMEVKNDGMD